MMIDEQAGVLMHKRVEMLQAMDFLVSHLNHEEGENLWLMEGVPDGAILDDFVGIAIDEELFSRCKEVFYETIRDYGIDGWYLPS